jgi:predicted small integral membrane protein
MTMNFDFSWMAWTWPTAIFFLTIFALLVGMGVWEYVSPGGNPRVGILRFETTRGDRLFVSLLGSAFINLAWLGLTDLSLWWALGLSVIYAIVVFRTV